MVIALDIFSMTGSEKYSDYLEQNCTWVLILPYLSPHFKTRPFGRTVGDKMWQINRSDYS